MHSFVKSTAKPEWGCGLLISDDGNTGIVLFENEREKKKILLSKLMAVDVADDQDHLVERAQEGRLIPSREMSDDERDKWEILQPLVNRFIIAGSVKRGIENIELNIYEGFILQGGGSSRLRSKVKTQLERWIRTNPSGMLADGVSPAGRLYEALFELQPEAAAK